MKQKLFTFLLALIASVSATFATPTEITVAKALEIGAALSEGAITEETYNIVGYVTQIDDNSFNTSYKNMVFWIADENNGAATNAAGAFEVYRGKPTQELKVGDKVSVETKIQNYKGLIESVSNAPVNFLEEGTGTGEASADVVFDKNDFAGQGVNGTGGPVSAEKNGVTFTCDKGFGDGQYVRCYRGSTVTIISATEQIAKIEFDLATVSGTSYDGGLDPVTVVNAKEWTVTLPSQARMNKMSIYFGTAEAAKLDTITAAEAKAMVEALPENTKSEKVAVKAYVASVKTAYNPDYGNITIWLTDDPTSTYGDIQAYRAKCTEEVGTALMPGNQVLVVGTLKHEVNAETGKHIYEIAQGAELTLLATEGILATEGTCGDNLTWTLVDSVLTISGTGAMADYPSATMPWHDYRSSIKTVAISDGVTSIRWYAFKNCSSLTSITIPNSVTRIEKSAFESCKSLTSVTINSDAIVNKAYTSSSNLSDIFGSQVTEYIIGDNVKGIGDCAFYECSKLTSITIPNSVTSIGSYAFSDCSSLTSVTIPNSVTSIVWYAFYNCSSLTSVTIPNSVTSIGDEAFCSCESLTSVTIPNSVTSIGDYAFYGCSSLTSVTIPNGVTSIGKEAFGYCSSLTSVTINSDAIVNKAYTSSKISDIFGLQVTEYIIGDNVKGIGDYAFKNCSSLTSVTIGNSVTSIGEDAFYKCSSLTSVTIGNSVTSIGDYAFWYCSSLTSVTIGNSVTSIGDYAFKNCSSLTSVTIPNSVTSIGDWSFHDCSSLTSVTIGNSVASIGEYAFAYCTSLTSVTIGNSVASIGEYAFAYCTSLTSITIPNSVTSIGSYAFNGCISLKSITIPNSITSLYNNTFANCTSLNEIILPASIMSIGENVFAGCTKLYDVYCYAMEPPTAYESSFANYNAFLHVPCECQRVYLLDVLFGNFKYIECISSDNTTTDEIVVTPSENEANVTWPSVTGAATYELVIKDKNGNIVCTLIFNANGQLTSIAFNAPSRNGVPAQTQNAGFSFTITGLDSSTGYDLTLTAKDNSGNAIQTETISFITTGGNVSTDIDQVQSDEVQSTKVIKDGQVLILRNGKTYTMQGQEVK